jgi:RNA polymerase sigma factor (sigma-70 family)
VTANLRVLVHAAAEGDQAAWDAIVARFERLVWASARAHGLSGADAAEVAQTTWLRLVENLDRIRDPDRLGSWLVTTARRESLRHLRLRGRELSTDDADVFGSADEDRPEIRVLAEERDAGLWRAFGKLSGRCQSLLRLLVAVDEPSYEEIGLALDMPVGAIGPTRMRCLEKLRAAIVLDPAFQGGAP